jgi:hypothetical protein
MHERQRIVKPRLQNVSLLGQGRVTKKKHLVTECISGEGEHLGIPGVRGVTLWVWGGKNSKLC